MVKKTSKGTKTLYYLAAVISATIFFTLLVEGFLTHSADSLSVAIIEYFIAFIFLGVAKYCKHKGKES